MNLLNEQAIIELLSQTHIDQLNDELDKNVKLPENLWVLVLHVSLQVEHIVFHKFS